METELKLWSPLPEGETCFSCRGCCLFNDSNSSWIPYFNEEEINRAVTAGIPPSAFPSRQGGRIIPIPHNEQVRCPALDPETHACAIYEARPLDCQLYPFILMWDHFRRVVLALHEACPFVQGHPLPETLVPRATDLTKALQASPLIETILANPGLIMATQPDTIPVATLDHLTKALVKKADPSCRAGARSSLTLFQPKDRLLFESYRSHYASELAHSACQSHLIWSDLLEYRWGIFDNAFCLFATSHGVTHLALPPLGGNALETATRLAFERLTRQNPAHIPPRMDNVDEQTAMFLKECGYGIAPSYSDYLYQRAKIVGLRGNRFRAQRGAVNQAARRTPMFRPFVSENTEDCLALFDRWCHSAISSPIDRMMREDARIAHHAAMRQIEELGLTGRVVEVDQRIVGYTFGFPLSSDHFCILLEIADPSIRGLSAWLFRESCREQEGVTWINTMDDSGISRLHRAKSLWHPARLIPSYTVTDRNPT